jgi:uncharacterized RDD family membrane protein YckC
VVTAMVFSAVFLVAFWMAAFGNRDDDTATAIGYVVSIPATWLYYALSESSSRQATVGKRTVGVVVTDVAGQRISFGRATGRFFAKWLNALTLGIGYLTVVFTREKRGLHDFIAGTVVLRKRDDRASAAIAA